MKYFSRTGTYLITAGALLVAGISTLHAVPTQYELSGIDKDHARALMKKGIIPSTSNKESEVIKQAAAITNCTYKPADKAITCTLADGSTFTYAANEYAVSDDIRNVKVGDSFDITLSDPKGPSASWITGGLDIFDEKGKTVGENAQIIELAKDLVKGVKNSTKIDRIYTFNALTPGTQYMLFKRSVPGKAEYQVHVVTINVV